MACGAGQALADIMCGKMPEPNFRFLGVERS
jgi:glycine/D-amino acid oxidase-like deaminating enzyme